MADAVCRAVPEGASTLSGWCSSITSTDSNQRAARAANAMASTAPSAKLGATTHADARAVRQVVAHARERLVGPARGADDQVDARVDQRVHVALGGRRDREVDRDLGTGVGDQLQVGAGVERGDELQVGGGLDGGHDGRSHAARRTQHGHPDALAHDQQP